MFHSCVRRSHPFPDQLPGEHTSDLAAIFSTSNYMPTIHYIHIIQLKLDRSMVVEHVPLMDVHYFFIKLVLRKSKGSDLSP